MVCLSLYYNVNENYDNVEKFYSMAVDHNDVVAMNNLAVFYENIKESYEQPEKYYLMAVKKNNIISMYNVAMFYKYIKKIITLMSNII